MVTFGQVGAYEEGQEEWKQYVERLEQYLIANRVKNAGKIRNCTEILLSHKSQAARRNSSEVYFRATVLSQIL